jgi:DNA-binding beta-propeller fold protein YncE
MRLPLLIAVGLVSLCVVGIHATSPRVAAACTVQLASPLVVPLGSVPGGVVIDHACKHVYLTNSLQNRVEVFSLETMTLEEPIDVGAQPIGLDVHARRHSALRGQLRQQQPSVVNLAKRVEARRLRMAHNPSRNDRPYSIGIASNGKALFSTTFNGSGFGGRVMEIDLATEQIAYRGDAGLIGFVDERTRIRSSHDRSVLTILMGQRIQLYRAVSNTFDPSVFLTSSLSDIGTNASGTMFLTTPVGTTPNCLVLDAGLNQIGTIINGSGAVGAAVSPNGATAYRTMASRVEILNLSTFLKTGEIALGDSVTGFTPYASAGQVDLSGDGKLLAVTTTTGFSLVQVQ